MYRSLFISTFQFKQALAAKIFRKHFKFIKNVTASVELIFPIPALSGHYFEVKTTGFPRLAVTKASFSDDRSQLACLCPTVLRTSKEQCLA